MLMTPIDTAAADEVRLSVGSTQNGVNQKFAKKPVRHSHANTAPHGCPGTALSARKVPAPSCPAMACHFRSRVRSDDQPEMSTPASPHRYTSDAQFSTLGSLASRPVAVRSPFTAVGSQNANAYPPMFVAKMPSPSNHTVRKRKICRNVIASTTVDSRRSASTPVSETLAAPLASAISPDVVGR